MIKIRSLASIWVVMAALLVVAAVAMFVGNAAAQVSVDYDADNDGLIEVSSLTQLDAIRWDMDADGAADDTDDSASYAAAFPNAVSGMGCPSAGCEGYELTTDLDFDTNDNGQADSSDDYWNGGAGWDPIGGEFLGKFNGNGNTIANLFIDATSQVDNAYYGLFTHITNEGLGDDRIVGEVTNLALVDVDVSVTASDDGSTSSYLGSVAGKNGGLIKNVYSTGSVTSTGDVVAGGLAGEHYLISGLIETSYSTATVTGSTAGGLAGRVGSQAQIKDSYSTGAVAAEDTAGGLVAAILPGFEPIPSITNSYATGAVTGSEDDTHVGGLVGYETDLFLFDPTIVADSYWDTATSGLDSSAKGVGKTTNQLQSPTSATGIYANWDSAKWRYGKTTQYPVLLVDFDGDGIATWQEFGNQRGAPPTVERPVGDQTVNIGSNFTQNLEATGNEVFSDPQGDPLTYAATSSDTAVATVTVQSSQLTVTAVAAGTATITVTGTDDTPLTATEVFVVSVPAPPTPTPGPTATPGPTPLPTDYDADDDGLIDVASLAQLNAIRHDLDGDGSSSNSGYAAAFPNPEAGMGCNEDETEADDQVCGGYELTADLDFDTNNDGRTDIAGDTYWNAGKGWEPIGTETNRFYSTLAGNGHTISGLFINRPLEGSVGLVGYGGLNSDTPSSLTGIGLLSVNVNGGDDTGGLCGKCVNYISVSRSYAVGSVGGGDRVGGLIGFSGGVVEYSYASVAVTSTGSSIGGLVGIKSESLKSSYATGTVIGATNVGGLVGQMFSDVTGSYATGSVIGGTYVGGLVGRHTNNSIKDSYAQGTVSGTNYVGGLLGWGHRSIITNSYSSGRVTGTGSTVNGFAAVNTDYPYTCTSNYWNTGTSVQTASQCGTGKTRQELKAPTSATGDFATWNSGAWDFGDSTQYPLLKADLNGDDVSTWQEFGYQNRYDYDLDDDGLIEISTLAQLDALRWDLDGNGIPGEAHLGNYLAGYPYPALGMGCNEDEATPVEEVCADYELHADLSFDTNGDGKIDSSDDYWNGGKGWNPIGSSLAGLDTTLHGNDHTVSHLHINRPNTDNVGLFGLVSSSGAIKETQLDHVDVKGGNYVGGVLGRGFGSVGDSMTEGSVTGAGNYVGGVIGWNSGTVSGSYSRSAVHGDDKVGGLAGYNSNGTVSGSYALGSATGDDSIGGLLGWNNGTVSDSYADATVSGRMDIGGLIGWNGGSITNSFAAGPVSGKTDVGGLVGQAGSASSCAGSHWNTETGQQSSSACGSGQKTYQLSAPTEANGIYAGWDAQTWDFGSAVQYPALKADWDGDDTATSSEFGDQRYDYDIDDDGLIEVFHETQLNAIRWDLDGDGSTETADREHYLAQYPNAVSGYGCNEDESAAADQVCLGYELQSDLDFDTNGNNSFDSGDFWWNAGNGWQPLGSASKNFTAILEGNGRAISNLTINRPDTNHVGLFGYVFEDAKIQGLALDDVNVTGNEYVGGLAGRSAGTVQRSYAHGMVSGKRSVGGLIGENQGTVENTYSTGSASGENSIGGLVGLHSSGAIRHSYSVGPVTASNSAGGFAGTVADGLTCQDSHWNTKTSGQSSSACGSGRSTTEMTSPQSATGIYAGWSASVWDFGADTQYPTLKTDWDNDGTATWQEFGKQDPLGLPPAAAKPQNQPTRLSLEVLPRQTVITLKPSASDDASALAYRIGDRNDETCSAWKSQGPTYLGESYTILSLGTLNKPLSVSDVGSDGSYRVTLIHAELAMLQGQSYCLDISAANDKGRGPAAKYNLAIPVEVDYDSDGDGLLELSNLAQFNAIRLDLNGDGIVAAGDQQQYSALFPREAVNMGCPDSGCVGYELTADLNLDTNNNGRADSGDAYWNGGAGWDPIDGYSGILDGSGHAIKNLHINRTGNEPAGLFGQLTNEAEVRNLGLTDVDITSGGDAGAFAGRMVKSSISRSYATGTVTATGHNVSAGGLVGKAAGHPFGRDTIRDSYSLVTVKSTRDGIAPGGLVGALIASGSNHPQIVNSYAAGLVQSAQPGKGGGLAAEATSLTWVLHSYWDRQTSGWETSAWGARETQNRLQTPKTTRNIFARWGSSIWDFGSHSQYPALKYDTNGDNVATVGEFGDQPRSATIPAVDLDKDNNGLIEINGANNDEIKAKLNAIRWDLNGDGSPSSNADDYWDAFTGGVSSTTPCVGVPCHGYELMGDVNLNQELWDPIGNLESGKWDATFRGNGYTVSHLNALSSSGKNTGLFGETTHRSVIEGVHIYSADVESYGGNNDDNRQNSAGALVGFNRGIVRESGLSYIWGDICSISGRNVSGGLVGGNEGIVERSWARCGDVNSKKGGGGLVGFNHPGGIVRDSWADGLVIVDRKGWKKGALIGRNFGEVDKSFSLGETRRGDNTYHGPLTGQQGGTVTDSYFVGHDYDEKYGGRHLTDEEIRAPSPSEPDFFADWDLDLWDLGDDTQYSALRVDANGDGYSTTWEIGSQRPSDPFSHRPDFVDGDAVHNIWKEGLSLRFRKADGDANIRVDGAGYRIAKKGEACHEWIAGDIVMLGETNGRATLSEDNGVYTMVLDRGGAWAFRPNGRVCIDVWFINTDGGGSPNGRRYHDIHMPTGPVPTSKPIKVAEAQVEPGKVTLAFRTNPYDHDTSVSYRVARNGSSCTDWTGPSATFKPGDRIDGAVLNKVGGLWRLELPVGVGKVLKQNHGYCVDISAHNDAGKSGTGRRWRDFVTGN